MLVALQRYDEAFATFGKALAINPAMVEAHLNRGSILMSRKRFNEAISCFEAAIRINGNYAEAHCNRAQALEECRRFGEALESCDMALALKSAQENAEFHATRANICIVSNVTPKRSTLFPRRCHYIPSMRAFTTNRGNILFQLKRFEEAFQSYTRAFRIDPQLDYVEGDRLFAKLMICDWAGLADEIEHLRSGVAAGHAVARPLALSPAESSQTLQTRCANLFADREFPAMAPLTIGQRYRHDRIQVAYLSADFRDHPVSHLLIGMFEHHDRARFETTAVSLGEVRSQRRYAGASRTLSNTLLMRARPAMSRSLSMLREGEMDVAIDLMGRPRALVRVFFRTGPLRSRQFILASLAAAAHPIWTI